MLAFATRPSLRHLPVGAFAIVMGVAGTARAWALASTVLGVPSWVGAVLAWFAFGIFLTLLGAYAAKAVLHSDAVLAEARHPVRGAFVATIPVSALVLAAAMPAGAHGAAAALWWSGAVAMAATTLLIMRTWIADASVQQVHIHPAWFIPIVGNLAAPLASIGPAWLAWYFFAVGLVFWIALLPIVLTRLFIAGVIPPRLAPTLAILVAPPAVAALAWVRLGGAWDDPLARVLVGVAAFHLGLLAVQAGSLRRVPFSLASWAYTFPIAAAAIVALAEVPASGAPEWTGWAMLVVTSVVTGALAFRTGQALARRELFRPED